MKWTDAIRDGRTLWACQACPAYRCTNVGALAHGWTVHEGAQTMWPISFNADTERWEDETGQEWEIVEGYGVATRLGSGAR